MRRANRWEGVEFTLDHSKGPQQCSISGVGMFLCVSVNEAHPAYIFLPDFNAVPVPRDPFSVRIQSSSSAEIWYLVKFRDEEEAKSFMSFALEKVTLLAKTVDAGRFRETFTVPVEGVTSEDLKPRRYTLTIDPELGQLRIERKGMQKSIPLDSTSCSALLAQYKTYKKSAATEKSFEVVDGSTEQKYVFVCETEHDMMRVVMMLFIHALRIIIERRRLKVRPREEAEYANVEIETEAIDVSEASKAVSTRPKHTKVVRKSKFDFEGQKPEESERLTFLPPEKRGCGHYEGRYAELNKALAKLYEPVPLELPSLHSFSVTLSTTKDSSVDLEQTLAEARGCLNVDGWGGMFAQIDRRTTAELVESRKKDVLIPEPVDISSIVDVRVFPEFSLQDYNRASEPSVQFLSVLQDANRRLVERNAPVSDGDSLGRAVALLCVAIMTNGMPNKHKFIPAYSYFCGKIEGVEQAVEMAKLWSSPWEQISAFVVQLLNTGSVIPLLREIRRNEPWISENFLITSLVANDSIFVRAIENLNTALMTLTFSMDIVPDIVTKGDEIIIQRFVQTPVMGHVGIQKCIKTPPFVPDIQALSRFLFRILSSNMHLDYLEEEIHSPGKTTFAYIKELVHTQIVHGNQDWIEMVDTVKAISPTFTSAISNIWTMTDGGMKDNGLLAWVNEGINRRKIHLWIFFLSTSKSLAEKFFSPDSVVRDMFRLKYIVNYLASMMRQ